MGRKAVLSLLFLLSAVGTLLLLAAAVLCRHAAFVSPEQGQVWPVLALLLPVVLLANAGALVWWLIRRRWLLILPPLAALLLNLGFISAMIQLPNLHVEQQPSDLRVATLNTHAFRAGVSRFDTACEVGFLMKQERVDVLCMQEFMLASDLTEEQLIQAFAPDMPCLIHERGAAIISRYPIVNHHYKQFPDTNNDYIWADLAVGEDTVRVISVHMQTSGVASLQRRYFRDHKQDVPVEELVGTLGKNSRIRAQQVRDIRAEVDSSPWPVILVGDFNDTPSSYTYRTIRGDMTDGFQTAGVGYAGTFRGMGGVLRIDYILCDPRFEAVRYRTLPDKISDHKAVVADLKFKR